MSVQLIRGSDPAKEKHALDDGIVKELKRARQHFGLSGRFAMCQLRNGMQQDRIEEACTQVSEQRSLIV